MQEILIEEIPVSRIEEFWDIHLPYLVADGIITDQEDREYFQSAEYRDVIKAHMLRPADKHHMIRFVRDGVRIGAAQYNTYQSEDGKCFILDYWVFPEFRGNGTGHRCFEALKAYTKADGARYYELNCTKENAHRFWKSLGFADCGVDEYDMPLLQLYPVSLQPMTRQMCHLFYQNFQNDPAIGHYYEYIYTPETADRYYDANSVPDRKLFAIMAGDQIVGECKLKNIDFQKRECSMGIHLQNDAVKGKGYGTQAERLVLQYAFEVLGMAAVNADAALQNTRSQHVLEKVGFRYTHEDANFKYYRCESRKGSPKQRKYYEAYDDRYRQVHSRNLQWFCDDPTSVVMQVINEFGITPAHKILELGCGEGRDAYPLLKQGYDLLATDISESAVAYAQKKWPEFAEHFGVLDCISGKLCAKYDFIYAVAVVHMLVEDKDRDGFYAFIRKHLTPDGIALICTMGDGKIERRTDIRAAFDLQTRTHEQTGEVLQIASTSCRMVRFETFHEELQRNGLRIVKEGITSAPPDFPALMYAVVKGEET